MARDRYVLVLAKSISEGNTYAKRAGLPRFCYRAVGNARSIRNIQVADVHVLPGFSSRPDRHAVLAELRHGRDIVMLDVEMPPKAEEPAVDQGDGMGQQLTLEDLMALNAQAGVPKSVTNAYDPPHEVPDWVKQLEADGVLEPEGWEPPEELSSTQVLQLAAGATGAEVAPMDERDEADTEPDAPVRKRRSRCADCGELTFESHDHSAPVAKPVDERAALLTRGPVAGGF